MNLIQQMQQLPTMKTQLIFDLESTGLLRRGSRIHCIVMRDTVDDSTHVFDHKPERDLLQGVKQLEQADALIGHNIIGYDIPLLKEQYPDFAPTGQVLDTLVLSRIFSILILLTVILSVDQPVCRNDCMDGIHSKPGVTG